VSHPGGNEQTNLLLKAKDALLTRSYGKARPLLEGLAATNHPEACYLLGALYWRGRGVPRTEGRAKDLFTLAAERGFAPAQYALGVLAQRGIGQRKDDAVAAQWFERAAGAGYPQALRAMARAYSSGRGVVRDGSKAQALRAKAAAAGDAQAMIDEALARARGDAAAPDPVHGLALLYAVVVRVGDPGARRAARALAKTLDPAAIERAQRRGRAIAVSVSQSPF
jgi:TPR repeat protein